MGTPYTTTLATLLDLGQCNDGPSCLQSVPLSSSSFHDLCLHGRVHSRSISEIHDRSESLGPIPLFSWLDGSMPRLRSNFSGSIASRVSLQRGPGQCNLEGAARTLRPGKCSLQLFFPHRIEAPDGQRLEWSQSQGPP